MVNISVLVSGGGSNLQAIMDGIADGRIENARIALVISSKADVYALERAGAAGIPTAVVGKDAISDVGAHTAQHVADKRHATKQDDTGARAAQIAADKQHATTRADADARAARILELLSDAATDMIVLAGYMHVVPAPVISKYAGRIINIHPALIPKHCGMGYFGRHVHESVLASGDKESGATVHYVDEGVDTGEIIIQERVPVREGDTPDSLAARVLETEHIIIVKAVERVLKSMKNSGSIGT
jgi:phosphoribosylglycinamide formyltransferase-1